MSTQEVPTATQGVPKSATTPAKPATVEPASSGIRGITWVMIVWTIGCVIWLIAGIRNVSNGQDQAVADCTNSGYSYDDCANVYHAGAGIGFGLVAGVWFAGFIVLSIIWAMTKPKVAPVVIVQAAATQPTFTEADVQAQIDKAIARDREAQRERAESLEIDAQIERERGED